jgi:hypothetical protein
MNFPGRTLQVPACSRSVLCEDFGGKRQRNSKVYDDLTRAVQNAMLTCRKQLKVADHAGASTSFATKRSRPRGRPQGSRDTKPRSKKMCLDVGNRNSTCSALSTSHCRLAEKTVDPSSTSMTSFSHACEDLDRVKSSAESLPPTLRELPAAQNPLPYDITFSSASPTAAVQAGVVPENHDHICQLSPPWETSFAAAAALTTGVASGTACDPACWDLPLPC